MNKLVVPVIVAVLVIGAIVTFVLISSPATGPAPETTTITARPEETVGTEIIVETNDTKIAAEDEIEAEDNVREVTLSARSFAFTPDAIRVKKGETVRIVLNVEEGFHDWVIDEFNARTQQVGAGETSETTFVAETAGEFEYYCSVGNHRQLGMVGTLIVEE